jgi:hypothetical protein
VALFPTDRCGYSAGNWLSGRQSSLIACPETVKHREEVRPMNAVFLWVLPLVVTVGE